MRRFVAFLIFSILSFCQLAKADSIPNVYTAVICSSDLRKPWFDRHPSFGVDSIYTPVDWSSLDKILGDIKAKAGSQTIYLDFAVHGNYDGLWLCSDKTDNAATFGYVVNHIETQMKGIRAVILFESCYAGAAYKLTIRGKRYSNNPDYFAEDCSHIPTFPCWGTGDNFQTIGPIMYLQVKHNIRSWALDLREYDPSGANRALQAPETAKGDKLTPTTAKIKQIIDALDKLP
jgi:hypothetical protein